MKKTISQEAKEIVLKRKVKLMGYGFGKEYWDVAGVYIKRDKNKFDCTCKHHSINPLDDLECTFIRALKIQLVIK